MVGALCVRERLRIQRLLQVVMNFPQLAESEARGGEAQRRERHHAELIASIVCNIWQDQTRLGPSVRQQPTRFSNITETEAWQEQRRFRDFCVHCGFHAGWCFAMDPRSMGKLRFTFSVALGRRCSACNTCNEVVPAYKEFLLAEQTPVPLIL